MNAWMHLNQDVPLVSYLSIVYNKTMFSLLAGSICEGSGCYGLGALVLMWLLLPIIAGLIVLVAVPKFTLKIINGRRNQPLTKSNGTKIYIAMVVVELLIVISLWQYPNTRFADKQNLVRTVHTIQKESVLLPENEAGRYTKVRILSPEDYARYEVVSFYGNEQTGYKISQQGSAQIFDKSNHECTEIPTRKIEYCKVEVSDKTYYYVFAEGLTVYIQFFGTNDSVEQLQVISRMRPYTMQSLEKVEYYK